MKVLALILTVALAACATPVERFDLLSRERGIAVAERNGDLEFVSEPDREQFADYWFTDVQETPEFRIGLARISSAMQQSADWVLLRRELTERDHFQLLLAYRSRDGVWRSISLADTQSGLALSDATTPLRSPPQSERDLDALGASDVIFQLWPRGSHEANPYWVTIHRDGRTTRIALLRVDDDALENGLPPWLERWWTEQEDGRGPIEPTRALIGVVGRLRAAILEAGATGED